MPEDFAYWSDRLDSEQRKQVGNAIDAFRFTRHKRRKDEHELYEALTNAGLTPEEADEMINIELEQS